MVKISSLEQWDKGSTPKTFLSSYLKDSFYCFFRYAGWIQESECWL